MTDAKKPRAKKAKTVERDPAPAPVVIEGYKGFDKSLSCRGFQYEIGKTYRHDGKVVRCTSGGFHFCENPLDTWLYYGPATSRYTTVDGGGEIDRAVGEDTKIAAGLITINVEITIPEIAKRAAAWVMEQIKSAPVANGERGHGVANGSRGHGVANGDYGHGVANGEGGHGEVRGKNSIAAALGASGTARACAGGAIVLAAYDGAGNLVAVRAATVGSDGIEAGKAYRLSVDGSFIEAEGV